MRFARWMGGIGLGTLGVAALFVAPALQARETHQTRLPAVERTNAPVGIGFFTPASADPKLAAVIARSGLSQSGFRFTPSAAAPSANRAATVRAVRVPVLTARADQPASISLAPIAYNLGVAPGTGQSPLVDITKVDLVAQPGAREHNDLGLATQARRTTSRVEAVTDRQATPATGLSDKPVYSIDVGGSFSLTRNLNVTAGLRYRAETERERMPRLTDTARDSQSLYVGTAFRF